MRKEISDLNHDYLYKGDHTITQNYKSLDNYLKK